MFSQSDVAARPPAGTLPLTIKFCGKRGAKSLNTILYRSLNTTETLEAAFAQVVRLFTNWGLFSVWGLGSIKKFVEVAARRGSAVKRERPSSAPRHQAPGMPKPQCACEKWEPPLCPEAPADSGTGAHWGTGKHGP